MITVFIITTALEFLGLVYLGLVYLGKAALRRGNQPPQAATLVISADPLRHP